VTGDPDGYRRAYDEDVDGALADPLSDVLA
jgi:hypothetical protein